MPEVGLTDIASQVNRARTSLDAIVQRTSHNDSADLQTATEAIASAQESVRGHAGSGTWNDFYYRLVSAEQKLSNARPASGLFARLQRGPDPSDALAELEAIDRTLRALSELDGVSSSSLRDAARGSNHVQAALREAATNAPASLAERLDSSTPLPQLVIGRMQNGDDVEVAFASADSIRELHRTALTPAAVEARMRELVSEGDMRDPQRAAELLGLLGHSASESLSLPEPTRPHSPLSRTLSRIVSGHELQTEDDFAFRHDLVKLRVALLGSTPLDARARTGELLRNWQKLSKSQVDELGSTMQAAGVYASAPRGRHMWQVLHALSGGRGYPGDDAWMANAVDAAESFMRIRSRADARERLIELIDRSGNMPAADYLELEMLLRAGNDNYQPLTESQHSLLYEGTSILGDISLAVEHGPDKYAHDLPERFASLRQALLDGNDLERMSEPQLVSRARDDFGEALLVREEIAQRAAERKPVSDTTRLDVAEEIFRRHELGPGALTDDEMQLVEGAIPELVRGGRLRQSEADRMLVDFAESGLRKSVSKRDLGRTREHASRLLQSLRSVDQPDAATAKVARRIVQRLADDVSRMDGSAQPTSSGTTGFGNHPEYSELGRSLADLALLRMMRESAGDKRAVSGSRTLQF